MLSCLPFCCLPKNKLIGGLQLFVFIKVAENVNGNYETHPGFQFTFYNSIIHRITILRQGSENKKMYCILNGELERWPYLCKRILPKAV